MGKNNVFVFLLPVVSDDSAKLHLMHELNSLPLLLLSQPLPPLPLLETFAERVVVVKLHLQVAEIEVRASLFLHSITSVVTLIVKDMAVKQNHQKLDQMFGFDSSHMPEPQSHLHKLYHYSHYVLPWRSFWS